MVRGRQGAFEKYVHLLCIGEKLRANVGIGGLEQFRGKAGIGVDLPDQVPHGGAGAGQGRVDVEDGIGSAVHIGADPPRLRIHGEERGFRIVVVIADADGLVQGQGHVVHGMGCDFMPPLRIVSQLVPILGRHLAGIQGQGGWEAVGFAIAGQPQPEVEIAVVVDNDVQIGLGQLLSMDGGVPNRERGEQGYRQANHRKPGANAGENACSGTGRGYRHGAALHCLAKPEALPPNLQRVKSRNPAA